MARVVNRRILFRCAAIQMTISFQSSHAATVIDTIRFVTGSVWLVTRRPKGPSTMSVK
jgi:hypothetical protein